MPPAWVTLVVSFLSDFTLTSATTLSAAMLTEGVVTWPNKAVVLLSVLSGILVAARRLQALTAPSLTPSPAPAPDLTAQALVALLKAQQPVTPLRVDSPKPPKDSS